MKLKQGIISVIAGCALFTSVNAGVVEKGEIRFKRGYVSGTVEGSVIRGDTDHYSLMAGAGQWMEVTITSLEDNAVFAVTDYSYGTGEDVPIAGRVDEGVRYWYGQLPNPGFSKDGRQNGLDFHVMGTRGNASYKMTVRIKNKPWK